MQTINETQQDRKPYETPAIVFEVTLDVRAGSPSGIPDPLNLFGTKK